ncbi:Protein of unknown function [Pyronema omphalodes CBS 100304]|uniref:Uncharacterized protein n=1 Tax=Pyronema omphalodes (strain CBS 100304) TaxID=1076935 RepID=U4L272_PYROM|nr:Protein of unknown function [Pyronema omphalodes CBS 100304]
MPPLSPVPEDDLPPPHGSVYTYPTPASPAHSRPPPPDMMIYDGPGSKESILASEYAPGRLHEIGGEYYGPRLRGLDTEASSLSDDIEERREYTTWHWPWWFCIRG